MEVACTGTRPLGSEEGQEAASPTVEVTVNSPTCVVRTKSDQIVLDALTNPVINVKSVELRNFNLNQLSVEQLDSLFGGCGQECQRLSLENCSLSGDRFFTAVTDRLTRNRVKLVHFRVKSCLQVTMTSLIAISTLFTASLVTLELSSCKLPRQAGIILSQSLQACTSLRHLLLAENNIRDGGLRAIADALKLLIVAKSSALAVALGEEEALTPPMLEQLDISRNGTTSTGFTALMQLPVRCLSAAGNAIDSGVGALLLSNALTLETLCLLGNPLSEDGKLELVCSLFRRRDKTGKSSLRELDLRACGFNSGDSLDLLQRSFLQAATAGQQCSIQILYLDSSTDEDSNIKQFNAGCESLKRVAKANFPSLCIRFELESHMEKMPEPTELAGQSQRTNSARNASEQVAKTKAITIVNSIGLSSELEALAMATKSSVNATLASVVGLPTSPLPGKHQVMRAEYARPDESVILHPVASDPLRKPTAIVQAHPLQPPTITNAATIRAELVVPLSVRGGNDQRRLMWTGPFAMPPPSAVGGTAYPEADGVSMATASPGRDLEDKASVRVTNAPTLPPAPRYSGSTMKARRDFMRAYQTYVHALSAFDTPYGKPFVMPVSGCIEERTCRLICMYELRKDTNLVTEEEWIHYFLQALEPDQKDYSVVDKAMTQLKMQTSFPDAVSRMGQLRANMHKILDEHNVEGVLISHEQKKLVKYLVAALEPADFREAIRKRLEYAQHKPLKSDVVKCYTWILEQLKACLVWQPQAGESHNNKSQTKGSKPPRRTQNGGNNGNKPDTDHSPTDTAGATSGTQPKSRQAILNCSTRRLCGSAEHLVRQCPGIRSDEVETLLAARKAANEASGSHAKKVSVATTKAISAGQNTPGVSMKQVRTTLVLSNADSDDDGTALATIDGLEERASLLDSKADDSVVNCGCVKQLEARGAVLEMAPVTEHLIPVGGQNIPVHRKVRFGEVISDTSPLCAAESGLFCTGRSCQCRADNKQIGDATPWVFYRRSTCCSSGATTGILSHGWPPSY